MAELLFEIGTEELPARFIDPAVDYLASQMAVLLTENRLSHGHIRSEGTPRRLVVMVDGIDNRQPDLTEEVTGPKAELAWDTSGQLTQIGQGFLKSRGLDAKDAYRKQGPKGEVIAAQLLQKGKAAIEVLPEILLKLIKTIPFQKTQRWEASNAHFARPVRSLLAILDEQVVPFEFAGVKSDNRTFGHRFLGPQMVQVQHTKDYLAHLQNSFVMLERSKRRQIVAEQAERLAHEVGGKIHPDPSLLEIVKNLVEYPWPVRGEFEREFLEIPKPILVSEMREHQKYFSVVDANDNLLPYFVFAAATMPTDAKALARGNARVLRARFEDGAFYFRKDCESKLADRLDTLAKVVFQKELGTLHDKSERIGGLTQFLSNAVNASPEVAQTAKRAAQLCKADLVTGVVSEFPELQGTMGAIYARRDSEKPAVADCIEQHYWPKFAGDRLPESEAGALVALADRLDTLTGVIGVGKIPTGNADPFGLRRAAIAVVRIILDRGYRLSLISLADASTALLPKTLRLSASELAQQFVDFMVARARGVFSEHPILVDGALAAGADDLVDLWARVQALSKLQKEAPDTFIQLLATLKRAGNIVQKAESAQLDPKLLFEPAEKELLSQIERARENASQIGMKGHSKAELVAHYMDVLTRIARLKPYVDRFFDEVMVMVDDLALQKSRLGLLADFVHIAHQVADFTKVPIDAHAFGDSDANRIHAQSKSSKP